MSIAMQTDVDKDVNAAIYRHKLEEEFDSMRDAHADLLRKGAESEGLL